MSTTSAARFQPAMTYNTLIPIAYKKNCAMADDASLRLHKSLLQRHLWQKLQHMFSETEDVEELATSSVLKDDELNVPSTVFPLMTKEGQSQPPEFETREAIPAYKKQLLAPQSVEELFSDEETDGTDEEEEQEEEAARIDIDHVPYPMFEGPASLSDAEEDQLQNMHMAVDGVHTGVKPANNSPPSGSTSPIYIHGQYAITTSHKRFNKADNNASTHNHNTPNSNTTTATGRYTQPWTSQAAPRQVV